MVKLINDGADCGGERGVVTKVFGCGTDGQAAEETSKQSWKPGCAILVAVPVHLPHAPFRSVSWTTSTKVAAGEGAGKTRKRTGKRA